MQRPLWIVLVSAAAVLWIGWFVLVLEKLVPLLHRHITMWGWLMAYVLCLAPVIVVAIGILVATRSKS